jgi:hypothetical protein
MRQNVHGCHIIKQYRGVSRLHSCPLSIVNFLGFAIGSRGFANGSEVREN